ncbi:SphA family protein [Novosphingobium terrae]|uniref:SphA family protein n=1 Tax=Novosphingobium terrae TaxID=2726189 RepID=UPI00197E2BD1|nr:transporter [Novosphingobium terrae]
MTNTHPKAYFPSHFVKGGLSTLACCSAFIAAATAHATENGTQHYPIGLLTASQSIMPEPGNGTVQNYDVIYDADRMNDGNGNKLPPDFHLNVKVQATRFIYTWPIELNGLTISSGSAVNFYNTSLSVGAEHGERFQLADTNFAPIMLRWTNKKNLHVMVATNVWAPTGSYKANRLVNAGLNYWSGDLEAGFTWMPTKRWEIGADSWTGFAFNSNHATGYKSGNTFDVDFVVGYRPLVKKPQLQLALTGDFFRQFSDDKVNGLKVGTDGFRGKQMALGPSIRWDFRPGLAVLFKYQKEFDVRNRPEGEKFWLELAVPLGKSHHE